jgi:ParB-like chromosome segregation protein Spo0J
MSKYDPALSLREILQREDLKAVLLKHAPKIETNPLARMVMGKTLGEIRALMQNPVLREKLDRAEAELLAKGE